MERIHGGRGKVIDYGYRELMQSLIYLPWHRKYWYNTESKQSSWEMPEVYKNAIAQTAPTPKPSMP